MKKTALTLITLAIAASSFAQLDTVANPGFERWVFNPQYDEPEDWTTLNPLASILGTQLAFKTTTAGEFRSGTSAIKLVTSNIIGVGMAPSICTNGTVNTAEQTIEGGVPINSRPTGFGGWYRFDPVNEDTGNVSITLTKWNSTTSSTDELASDGLNISNTNGTFVNFEFPISYNGTDVPDTVLIIMASGGSNPQEGTTLFLDDLYYTYPQGIESPESVGLILYPNPTSDIIRISSEKGLVFSTASIYSLDGALVQFSRINSDKANIDVSKLSNGSYIIQLIDRGGIVVNQNFTKN